MLHLIVAVGENGAIGKDNRLLWHLPEDLKHFKSTTMGHALIMGRKTFESLPGMLPGRPHIVLTHNREWSGSHPEVQSYHDLAELLSSLQPDEDYYVIGGGEIYAALLPYCQYLHLTEVADAPAADTFFPSYDKSAWELVEERRGTSTEQDPEYYFRTYRRKSDRP